VQRRRGFYDSACILQCNKNFLGHELVCQKEPKAKKNRDFIGYLRVKNWRSNRTFEALSSCAATKILLASGSTRRWQQALSLAVITGDPDVLASRP
jgi:hypothetical protein